MILFRKKKESDKEAQRGSFQLLRRTAPNTSVAEHFILLPAQTTVTVNGSIHANGSRSGTVYIGPLGDPAVIEFLGQPIYFWPSKEAAINTREMLSTREATSKETEDTGIGDADTLSQGSDNFGSEDNNRQCYIIENGTNFNDDDDNDDDSSASDDLTRDMAFNGDSPCEYLRTCLNSVPSALYLSSLKKTDPHITGFINPVLLAINRRQSDHRGFAVRAGGYVLRPGLPLIVPCWTNQRYYVLIVIQYRKGQEITDEGITAHVMDPMEWDSTLKQRNSIHQQSLSQIMAEGWLRNIVLEVDDIIHALPKHVLWVESAQTTDQQEASTLTIMNAWALAMGLTPNSKFTVTKHFIEDAGRLFYLVRQGHGFNWKLLFAFFLCHKFTQDDTEVPSVDRRFSVPEMPVKNFEKLQLSKERDRQDMVGTENHEIDIVVQFKEGKPHNEAFGSDYQGIEFREAFVKPLIQENQWSRDLTNEEIRVRRARLFTRTTRSRSSLPEPTLASRLTASASPRNSEILVRADQGLDPRRETLVDYDPCGYLMQHLEALGGESDIEYGNLDQRKVSEAVGALIQIVAHTKGSIGRLSHLGPSQLEFGTALDKDFLLSTPHDKGLILFLPWIVANHSVLFVVQFNADKTATMYAFDSAPWLSGFKHREGAYEQLKNLLTHMSTTELTLDSNILWIVGPQPLTYDDANLGYLTICTAWAIALNLDLNRSFYATTDFYIQSRRILDLVIEGRADWKLVQSFLQCNDFVSYKSIPPVERSFVNIISPEGSTGSLSPFRRADESQEPISSMEIPAYKFPPGQSHRVELRTDNWNGQTDLKRLNFLLKHGISILDLDRNGLKVAYYTARKKLTIDTASNSVQSACKYVDETIKRLHEEPRIQNDLLSLETQGQVDFTGPRNIEIVSQAIASVTLSIPMVQNRATGYSFLSNEETEACMAIEELKSVDEDWEDIPKVGRAIRPGQPMLLPLKVGNHIVLLVLQYDEDHIPAAYVLDSRKYHYDKNGRTKLHRIAEEICQQSGWSSGSFNPQTLKDTIWIPCSQETRHWASGFHTIFNAWAIALGLELNQDFEQDWDPEGRFFKHAKDIITMARIGSADWHLIESFLVCYKFVQVTNDPAPKIESKKTIRVMNSSSLSHTLSGLSENENKFLGSEYDENTRVWNGNRRKLEGGQTYKVELNSDKWSLHVRSILPWLAEQTRLNPSLNDAQVIKKYFDIIFSKDANEYVREFLAQKKGDADESSDFIPTSQNPAGLPWELKENLDLAYIDSNPCEFARNRYYYKALENKKRRSHLFNESHFGEYLDFELVMLCIAAVVEAIDSFQNAQFGRKDSQFFNGGFTLATSISLQSCQSSEPMEGMVVSRPGRCWLMPIGFGEHMSQAYYGTEEADEYGISHFLLAVLQEQEGHITVHFLDSSQNDNEFYAFLFRRVQKTARDLKWISDDAGEPQFEKGPRIIRVPSQTNGWACGYHTILNAWILALGLTPNLKARFWEDTYRQIREIMECAFAGLLDWKTLVAWLFCCKFTVEGDASAIPDDRKFKMTTRQTKDTDLQERIQEMRNNDELLKYYHPNGVSYDRGNNVRFCQGVSVNADERCLSTDAQQHPGQGGVGGGSLGEGIDLEELIEEGPEDLAIQMAIEKSLREARSRHGLERAFDDVDDWPYPANMASLRQLAKEKYRRLRRTSHWRAVSIGLRREEREARTRAVRQRSALTGSWWNWQFGPGSFK